MAVDQIQLNDRFIEYRWVAGAGSDAADLVMLHEGLGSMALWKDFPERLARATGCRVLAYSRHGHGASSVLREPRAVDYMHDEAQIWLPLLLQGLGVRRPILFGHSDGASIALIYAALSSSELRGVVALAPHVRVEDLTINGIRAAREAYQNTDFARRLALYHGDVDATFWGWNNIWLDPAFRQWSIEAQLPSIRCPVMGIQGREDEYGTLEQMEMIQRAVHQSELLVLDNCRHSPHRDHPEAVLAASARFIIGLNTP